MPKVSLLTLLTAEKLIKRLSIFTNFKSIQTTYWVVKLIIEIGKESPNYHTLNNRLLEKYGSRDDSNKLVLSPDKKLVVFTPENKILYDKEFNDLILTQVEINVPLINLEEIVDKDGSNILSPQEILLLDMFLDTTNLDNTPKNNIIANNQ